MAKLVWVALPLVVAAAALAWLALRRRRLTRQALNAWSSLLLLAYLATTAGLGIFWVANQQLPVFDWHYLFGYATVLLVLLHLSLNLGSLWRQLATSIAARAQQAREQAARRRVLGLLGALFATGAAFVFGLRHGRTELRVAWPEPGAAPAAATAPPLVEQFHAFSSTSRTGVLARAPSVDWGDPPPTFKAYPGAATIALPPPRGPLREGAGFDLAALGTALWHTAGITGDAQAQVKLRASPSSGALFPTELYVCARDLPGLWHCDALAHRLERVAGEASVAAVAERVAPGDPALRTEGVVALVFATAVFRRCGHKYRDRSYRYVLADLGHALENLSVAAAACAAGARPVDRFDEGRAAALLGIDEAEEGVLALVAIRPQRPVATGDVVAPQWRVPPAPTAQALGVTGAIHLATSLRVAPGGTPLPGSIALPRVASALAGANPLEVIAARRSVRVFSATPVPLDALAGLLAAMTTPPPAAVRVSLVANAVAGLAPGAYRHDAAAHALVAHRPGLDLRAAARAAALDQDVIGNAAVVFVLTLDRAAVAADPAGAARGYRHAFIEAGQVGERVYLEAGARGLAACGVGAFYDDEAAALVGVDADREWVVHFAALGFAADR